MSTPSKATAFPCPHPGCPRVFEVIRHLNRHVEIHDPNTKRFACPWDGCDHTTRQRSNLKTHMKKHTNTKDLCCSKCDYATGDPALALRHQQRAHGYKPRTYRKRRSSISEASSSSSSPDRSEASFPTTPTADEKPELDNGQSYPFDESFTSVHAKSLYPAAEAIPALSYPAFDVDSLSGYDWPSPIASAESPVSSPDIWSSWAPTPTFQGESSSASFDWSSSLNQNVAQFVPASPDMPAFHSTPYLSSPAALRVPYTEQSLEQFFSFAMSELYPSPSVSFPSEPIPSYYDPYSRGQFSTSTQFPGFELFNGL